MNAKSLVLPLLATATASLATATASASDLPTLASINLCTDQLLLSVAEPSQIVTLSWLAADPEESMLAAEAATFPPNYGSVEEILRYAPDVVIGGEFTSAFTRRLLADLGFTVVTVAPANSIEDIERNLLTVASAAGREARGREVIGQMRARVASLRTLRLGNPVPGIVMRPGGFTVGAGTLADELLQLAGIDNIAARHGLDSWGSLSIEALLRSGAELLIFTGFRADAPSLANEVFAHPVLGRLAPAADATALASTYWACGVPESLRSAELLLAATGRRLAAARGDRQ